MKKILTIILISIISLQSGVAQVPNWAWAKSARGPGHDYAQSLSTDADGNSYVAGYFQPPQDIFDTDTLYATASANSNFFAAKYDSAGNVIWAKGASGNAESFGTGIKQDAFGNCIATGYYYSNVAITFGSVTLAPTTGFFVSAFLVKYDTAGNVVWAKNSGAASWAGGNFAVDLDATGNIYLAGTFDDSTYLEKYDQAGNLLWQKYNSGNSNTTHCWSISTDAAGNNFIAGYFLNPLLTFDATTLSNTSSGYEIFIVKTDSTGNVIWAKNDGAIPSLYKPFISSDAAGNCYVTGYYNGTSAMFGTTTLFNAGANDIFVVKYDSMGNVVWAKRAGGVNFDDGNGIKTDANGNSYVTGFFRGVAAFGSYSLSSAGDPEIFVAKYDSAGTVLWAKKAGGSDVDGSYGVGIDASGNCYIAGNFFSSTPFFDLISLTNSNLTTNPSEIFVAKLGSATSTGISPAVFSDNDGSNIYIYPNPMNDEFTVNGLLFPAEIKIYAVLGKEILSKNITTSDSKLKTGNIPSGIYFYELKNKNGEIGKGKMAKK